MIDSLRRLGSKIEAQWKAKKYSAAVFPELAYRGLEEARIHERFSVEEIARWGLKHAKRPLQADPGNNFGEPPLTVWRGTGFTINIYFWLKPEISIHDHAFCGAFSNLMGNSLHCTYTFTPRSRKEATANIGLGNLDLKETTYLQRGSLVPILPGRQFIHRVWHVSRPTVTLVVRTTGTEYKKNHYEYLESGLATRGLHLEPAYASKREKLLGFLFATRHPDRYRLATELFLGPSLITSWHNFYPYCHLVFAENGEDEGLVRIHALLEQMKKRHGERASHFRHAAEVFLLYAAINWDKLQDEEHRVLIVLLRTFQTREGIYEWIQRLYPGQDPDALIVKWISAMDADGSLNLEFSPLHLQVLGPLLKGRSPRQIAHELSGNQKPTADTLNQLGQACDDLRETALFSPLFLASNS